MNSDQQPSGEDPIKISDITEPKHDIPQLTEHDDLTDESVMELIREDLMEVFEKWGDYGVTFVVGFCSHDPLSKTSTCETARYGNYYSAVGLATILKDAILED